MYEKKIRNACSNCKYFKHIKIPIRRLVFITNFKKLQKYPIERFLLASNQQCLLFNLITEEYLVIHEKIYHMEKSIKMF